MMDSATRSNAIFAGLILLAAALAATAPFLPQGSFLPVEELPLSPPRLALINGAAMLVLYGGIGYLGLRLTRLLGWTDVWAPDDDPMDRWYVPGALGLGLGVAFIAVDTIAASRHALEALPHPPFPTSIIASAVAAISEEVLFRLFLLPTGVWILSDVMLGGRLRDGVFWILAIFSGLAFAAGHLPSVTVLYGLEVGELPAPLLVEIFLLNGALSLVAAQQLRAHGLLAAVGVHWWVDVVWHVLWGLA